MITIRKFAFGACLVISVSLLAASFGLKGLWLGTGFALLCAPAWFFARKYPASGLPLISLLGSVVLAVIGLLAGAPAALMILGSGAALAAWDLLWLDHALGNSASGPQTLRYEFKHLQWLALSLGSGLIVAILGHFVNVRFSSFVLMLLVAFVIFALDRIWGIIKKKETS